MSLKLFRSTGYSSILAPGETRVLMHPGWVVVATSLWVGFACNVSLWRSLGNAGGAALPRALLLGCLVSAACALLLSLLGWRRTLKPAATLLLALGAAAACGAWARGLAFDAALFAQGLTHLLPDWASLMRWQVLALLVVLGVLPMLWVWSTDLRRLPGPAQLRASLGGMALSGLLAAGAGWLLAA